jgi:hypothetical protein
MQHTRHSRFCLLLMTLIALPRIAWGQVDCSGLFPLRAGAAWEMATYDGQQTQLGSSRYALVEKSNVNGMQTWQANRSTHEDRTDVTWPDSLDLVCDSSGFGIGMQWYRGYTAYTEGTRVVCYGGVLRFPRNLAVGMRLPEAKLSLSFMRLNQEMARSSTRVYRRLVTGEASKTTPAGTFACWVIEATVEQIIGGHKYVSEEKIWLSKGSGIVASELRSKGKLSSYTELTSITP